jgi:hypothetical protein
MRNRDQDRLNWQPRTETCQDYLRRLEELLPTKKTFQQSSFIVYC